MRHGFRSLSLRLFAHNRRARAAPDLLLVLAIGAALVQRLSLSAQSQPHSQAAQTTSNRLKAKGWWPTAAYAERKNFVGTDVCGGCHQDKVLRQQLTSMARASSRASETDVLRSHPSISHSAPPFQTVIVRDRASSTYTVMRGGESMSGQIFWSMGDGVLGKTFILRVGVTLFESQLSYFPSLGGLDLTPGHVNAPPQDLLVRAFGQPQTADTAQRCFACHTTGSSLRGNFDPARATPGVTCEACHGPGALHVRAMQDNQFEKGRGAILNPASFDPAKLVDFCGACHRAPMDVVATKDYTPINVRFQPYRLSKSRCWSRPDRRISCIACHDPHDQVRRDITFYDAKCLACHAPGPAPATSGTPPVPATGKPPTCRVSTSHCVSCHMPKYRISQLHGSFTDHDIRVVNPGDPFPL
jgi:hypothetical protein